MRVLNERLAGRDSTSRTGLLKDARGWSQVLPDPDEPLVHLYAEGETTEASEELEREVREPRRGDHAGRRGRDANLCRSLKLRLTLGIRTAY